MVIITKYIYELYIYIYIGTRDKTQETKNIKLHLKLKFIINAQKGKLDPFPGKGGLVE